MARLLLIALVCLSAACSIPVRQARLDPLAAPTAVEVDAAERVANRRCGNTVGFLFPGAGPYCLGRTEEAAVLAGLTVVELGAGVAVNSLNGPQPDTFRGGGRVVPGTMVQDLYMYSISRTLLDLRLAQWKPYSPQDQLTELVAAPFNVQVLKKPAVWGGTLALLGGATAVSAAMARPVPGPRAPPGDPNFFGARVPRGAGVPLFAATSTVFFEHVAIAEEALFRGVIQSDLVRATGSEVGGWALGSLIFGAVHATNALGMPPEDRLAYIGVAVPWITLTGSWIGWVYKQTGYSLAAPVAIHFWYDVLLSALQYAVSPDEHLFSARFTMPLGARW